MFDVIIQKNIKNIHTHFQTEIYISDERFILKEGIDMNEYDKNCVSDMYPKYVTKNRQHIEASKEVTAKHKGLIIKTAICVAITAVCFLMHNYETVHTTKINEGIKYLISYNDDYKPILQNVKDGFLKLPALFTAQNDAEEAKSTFTQVPENDNNAEQE